MTEKRKAYIQLHIAVILFGLTAILGDLISISAISLVWWRVMITALSLLYFVGFGKKILRLPFKVVLIYMGIGVIVGLHWITFYGSIKLANASIALAALSCTSLFTSFIEPLFTDKKLSRIEMVLGLLIIPAMWLIAADIALNLQKGLWIGILSAFFASTFATFNKKMVDAADSYEITFIEMSSAFLSISLYLPFIYDNITEIWPTTTDWIYLIILSLLCTTLAFILTLLALKHVSAFDANLVINLEPVYGIILAIIILKENKELNTSFYIGMLMILMIVFAHPYLKKKIT